MAAVKQSAARGPIIVAVLACLVVWTAVFWAPLVSSKTLFGPDDGPEIVQERRAMLPSGVMGSWGSAGLGKPRDLFYLQPTYLLYFLGGPSHHLKYMVDSAWLMAAAAFFLRRRRVACLPVAMGVLAVAFSGYSFTLISAGHFGMFEMMPFAVLMLALLDGAVEKRSPFWLALAGACVAYGMMGQPDVMMLFVLLAAVYGAFKFIRCRPGERGGWGRYAGTMAVGVLAAAVVAGLLSAGTIMTLRRTILPGRAAQIEESRQDPWEFATNWSMPPEEILEFVAPCVYGLETGDPRGPYWGRVGRTLGWMNHRQGLMNLRQHTVYMGVIQLVFAAYGVAWALRRKRDDDPSSPAFLAVRAPGRRADILFWTGAFVIPLLLALGRYFPLYRLFYLIPGADSMRAPIKFLHLSEVALAFLFAFGVDAFGDDLRAAAGTGGGPARVKRVWLYGLLVSGVLGLGLLVFGYAAPPWFHSYWTAMGMGAYRETLTTVMRGALGHGGILFLLAAAIFFGVYCRGGARGFATIAPYAVLVILGVDLAIVARRYVRVVDFNLFFDANPITKTLAKEPEPFRVTCPFPGSPFEPWRRFMFRWHRVDLLEPENLATESPRVQDFYRAGESVPVRFWQLTNTRYVLGPADRLAGLLGQPGFEKVLSADLDPRGRVIANPLGNGRIALVRFAAALPRALVYHQWESVSDDEWPARLASPEWNPALSVGVAGDIAPSSSRRPPTRVTSIVHRPQKVALRVNLPEPGILLLNDLYDPAWSVFVDGARAELLRCNLVMRGVGVPAGEHRVIFVYRPFLVPFLISAGALGALLVWAVVRRRAGPGTPVSDSCGGPPSI